MGKESAMKMAGQTSLHGPAGSEPTCAWSLPLRRGQVKARRCWDACYRIGLARALSGAPACPHVPPAAPSQGFRAWEMPA